MSWWVRKLAPKGYGPLQGLEIEEKLLWKYERTCNFWFYPGCKRFFTILFCIHNYSFASLRWIFDWYWRFPSSIRILSHHSVMLKKNYFSGVSMHVSNVVSRFQEGNSTMYLVQAYKQDVRVSCQSMDKHDIRSATCDMFVFLENFYCT